MIWCYVKCQLEPLKLVFDITAIFCFFQIKIGDFMKHVFSLPLIGLIIAGCGGGGTSGDLGSYLSYGMSSPKLVEANKVASASGTPRIWRSTLAATGYGKGYAYADRVTTNSGVVFGAGRSSAWQMLPLNHIVDTEAEAAWRLGWTGAGTTISVIDDFSESNASWGWNNVIIPREVVSGIDTMNYNMNYSFNSYVTHGEIVANIAGGDGVASTTSGPVSDEIVASATRTYCSAQPFNYYRCGDNYVYSWRTLYDDLSISFTKVPGVAKDATVITNHVDLSRYQNVENTLNSIYAHFENSKNAEAVNLSVGFNINTVGMSYANLISSMAGVPHFSTTDAVVAVAAGNGGAACTEGNLNGCNAIAVALAIQPNTKSNTILVGATEGSGFNEKIATYSSRAGMFKDRYMMASGDTGLVGIQGTSFAAPRIAGAAAILRQKFPNLSGSDAASVLLLTANKDINNDGFDDFSGTSSFYGHGKLDLLSALSPQGSLVVK